MTVLPIHKLFTSPHAAWDQVARIHPPVVKLFALVVTPLSLIPPLMLGYAGQHDAAALFPQVSPRAWSIAALTFLVAEWLTVPFMAWGIRSVVRSKGMACDYHDAFTLAALAPIPMWLSGLILFTSNLALFACAALAGLLGSVLLIFRGVEGILRVEEDLVAFQIAYIVTAMGLIAWALLIMLELAPSMA